MNPVRLFRQDKKVVNELEYKSLKLNILQKQLVDKKYHLLDPLLRIIMNSKETRLSNLIANLN